MITWIWSSKCAFFIVFELPPFFPLLFRCFYENLMAWAIFNLSPELILIITKGHFLKKIVLKLRSPSRNCMQASNYFLMSHVLFFKLLENTFELLSALKYDCSMEVPRKFWKLSLKNQFFLYAICKTFLQFPLITFRKNLFSKEFIELLL